MTDEELGKRYAELVIELEKKAPGNAIAVSLGFGLGELIDHGLTDAQIVEQIQHALPTLRAQRSGNVSAQDRRS